MARLSAKKRVLFVVVALLGLSLPFGAGYVAARYPSARQINKRQRSETLGQLVQGETAAAMGRAYLDPARARAELSTYSWAPPTVPAPFVCFVPRPGASHNARINAHGMRSERAFEPAKAAGVVRVFLTGGSTAYGSGAPSQDATIGALLERRLREAIPACEVWTLASPAWTSTHERLAITQRISEWSPDLVISLSGANDAHWSQLGNDTFWLRTYEDRHFFKLLERAYGRGTLVDVTSARAAPIEPDEVARRFAKNVGLARFALGEVPLLVALQPILQRTQKALTPRERAFLEGKPASERDYYDRCFDAFAGGIDALGGPSVDLSGAFDGVEEDVYLDSFHFGDRGNVTIAEQLAQAALPLLR